MATTPSWLSCLKPHISWAFGQLRHFNFSGPGATAFVLSQEGDIRPPFFVYGKAGPTVLATPRPWGAAPNPAAFEKAGKTFTFLHPTQARATCSPLSASPGALKRRSRLPPRSVLNGPRRGPGPRLESAGTAPRLENPGTGRGRASAARTGAAVAAAPKRELRTQALGCNLGEGMLQ